MEQNIQVQKNGEMGHFSDSGSRPVQQALLSGHPGPYPPIQPFGLTNNSYAFPLPLSYEEI